MLATRNPVLDLPVVDERSARATLRAQIARLEQRLAAYEPVRGSGSAEPRLLTIAGLERTRDELLARRDAAQAAQRARAAGEREAQRALEAMLADPAAHRGRSIALKELGLPGCGVYRAKPRLGIIGRLAGWWEITLSSGCP